jgi:hypothetical protein
MGGLTVFQNSVQQLLTKARRHGAAASPPGGADWARAAALALSLAQGHKKITPFFIPYAITNMGGALLAIETGFMVRPQSRPISDALGPRCCFSPPCALR